MSETRLSARIAARETRGGAGGLIPAVLHQTFRTAEVTPTMRAAVDSWIDLNPEYEYRFHDDAAARALIAERYDARTLAAFDRIEAGAFKADFWRYCMLYAEGGVYADIDTVCLMPLSELLCPADGFVSAASGPPRDFAIYNCFIAARPGHPFLAAAIERATEALHRPGRYDGYIVTGPGNLGHAVNRVLGRAEDAPHAPGASGSSDLAFRLLEKRSATAEMRRHLAWEGHPALFTEYEDYKDDLSELGVRYWRDMPVYTGVAARARRAARRLLAPLRK